MFSHEVQILGLTRGSSIDIAVGSASVRFHQVDRSSISLPSDQVRSGELIKALAEFDPEAILVRGVGTAVAHDLIVRTSATVAFIIGGRLIGPELGHAQAVLVESAAQGRLYRVLNPWADRIMLPKLVDDAFFNDDFVEKTFDVVTVGSLTPWKNHRALVPLAEAGLRIAIIGDGSCRDELEQLFSPFQDQVWFAGRLTSSEVAYVLRAAKLMVHPSLSEGFPRAVAEGMAASLPVVALRGVVGAPLVSGRNGILVRERGLKQAVLALVADDERMNRMSANARLDAAEGFGERALEAAVVRVDWSLSQSVTGPPVGRRRTTYGRLSAGAFRWALRSRRWLSNRRQHLAGELSRGLTSGLRSRSRS